MIDVTCKFPLQCHVVPNPWLKLFPANTHLQYLCIYVIKSPAPTVTKSSFYVVDYIYLIYWLTEITRLKNSRIALMTWNFGAAFYVIWFPGLQTIWYVHYMAKFNVQLIIPSHSNTMAWTLVGIINSGLLLYVKKNDRSSFLSWTRDKLIQRTLALFPVSCIASTQKYISAIMCSWVAHSIF